MFRESGDYGGEKKELGVLSREKKMVGVIVPHPVLTCTILLLPQSQSDSLFAFMHALLSPLLLLLFLFTRNVILY